MMKSISLGIALAVALAALPVQAAGNVAKGKEKSATCVACHGVDGNSALASFPRLAGQHEDYLAHTLNAYKSGSRKNEVMKGMVATLSKEDIADLAAFFAAQKGLVTKR